MIPKDMIIGEEGVSRLEAAQERIKQQKSSYTMSPHKAMEMPIKDGLSS